MRRNSHFYCISFHIDPCTSCVQNRSCSTAYGQKAVQCLETSFLFGHPLLYLILLPWTFTLFNSHLSVWLPCACVNKLHHALLVDIQGCNHLASVVGSVRACTGTEDAASSKFGLAKVNDGLKRLKDTILIYLFLTSSCSCIRCITLLHAHSSPTVPLQGPFVFHHVCTSKCIQARECPSATVSDIATGVCGAMEEKWRATEMPRLSCWPGRLLSWSAVCTSGWFSLRQRT